MADSPGRRASTDSFRSAHSNMHEDKATSSSRFPPEEEQALVEESNAQKANANRLYASSAFTDAIGEYDKALASCPRYLDYEVAVLKSNIAACHIKLSEWKEAVAAASAALDGLERVQPTPKKKNHEKNKQDNGTGNPSDKQRTPGASKNAEADAAIGAGAEVVELSDDEDTAAAMLAELQLSDERRAQVRSLRAKSLMRRAKANYALGGWAALASAESDYKDVLALKVVPPADDRFVRHQLATLPAQINVAKDKEMAEMMGKLKDLGNGILKPFGLSTDMFKFQQDPATGGYNMSFGGNSSK